MEMKAQKIFALIIKHFYPKDQFGFYTESQLYQDILNIYKKQNKKS